jgi:hypothetical protein
MRVDFFSSADMNENTAAEFNLDDLVDLTLEDLKDSVLRAANIQATTSASFSHVAALNRSVPEISSTASLLEGLIADCAVLESNCSEYRTVLDLIGQEVKLLRKKLQRSEQVAKEVGKFKALLKTELVRSRELELENQRYATQNTELISVMRRAVGAPEDSTALLRSSQHEVDSLREESARLRELLAVMSEYEPRFSVTGSHTEHSMSAHQVELAAMSPPPAIVLVTPPRSPEGHRFTVIKPPNSPVATPDKLIVSQPSTPEEELADMGPQTTLRIETNPSEDDDPSSGSDRVDLTLHDSHALPSVTSPKLAGISPMRRPNT